MSITVYCKYADGDVAASPFSHVLILSFADAVQKGFRLLNEKFIIRHKFMTSEFEYPVGGYQVRRGVYIVVSFPEMNVYNVPAWVYNVKKRMVPNRNRMTLGFEVWERSQGSGPVGSGIVGEPFMITEDGEYIGLD